MVKSLDSIQLGRQLTFGTDPEVFIRDGKNTILPAFKFLPSKTKPIQGYRTEVAYSTVYNDGFQAEMSVGAHGCIAYVIDGVHLGLRKILDEAQKTDPGVKLVVDNAPMIPIQMLRDAPEENVIFGCDPSYNAYHMGGKCADDPRKLRYRFTGFHIHVSGWQVPEDYELRQKLFVPYIKAMDKMLGIYFTAAGEGVEVKKRREYYGLAGEYRLPDHGLEYRVLSSVCLSHPGVANLAFEMARGTIALVDSNLMDMWVGDENEVVDIINSTDVQGAREVLQRNMAMFDAFLCVGRNMKKEGYRYGRLHQQMGLQGITSVIKDPNNFVNNWKLNAGAAYWIGHCDGKLESWGSVCQNYQTSGRV
jgi:hypothetical protein